MEDFKINFEDLFNRAKREVGKANIVIAGKTGVGKSTLINSIFEEPLAKTGVGKPITDTIKEYTKEGFPISLFDTKGFELVDYKKIINDLQSEIEKRKGPDASEHIHIAWFCISDEGKRIEDAEIDFINELSKSIPVIIVLTKSLDNNLDFYNKVKTEAINAKQIIRVLALPFETPIGIIPQKGLEELAEITSELIPDAVRTAFVAAQKVSLKLRVKRSEKIVAGAAIAAGTAAAIPIPFSDALTLAPIQIGMLASISISMGLNLTKAFLSTLVTSAAGVLGATYLGRIVFTNLLKLIPLVGSLSGGVIGAATASTITALMGGAYIQAIKALMDKKEPITAKNLSATFKALLKAKKR